MTRTSAGETTKPSRKTASTNNGHSNRLPTGAIVGSGMGAPPVITIAVGGMITWLRCQENHLGQTTKLERQESELDGQPILELALTEAKGSRLSAESLDCSAQRHELDTEKRSPVAVELPVRKR
jgi:hypothetical protein